MDEETEGWVRLAEAPGLGAAEAAALVERFGSAARVVAAGRGALASRGLDAATVDALVAPPPERMERIAGWLAAPGHHLVSRAKINAVAWTPAPSPEKRKRGRPRAYGEKIALRSLFDTGAFQCAPSPVYGEKDVTVEYMCIDLLWRPVGRLVRFVLVKHPARGNLILLTTLLSMQPLDVLHIYSLRFKIETAFRAAAGTLGAYFYHFWMRDMKPIRRRSGDQYLHRESDDYRRAVRRKIRAYHAWAQLACIAQGLLMHLAVNHHTAVWGRFRSWLRTMRPDLAPSELVVSLALRSSLPEFLFADNNTSDIALFLLENTDIDRLPNISLVA